MSSQGEMKTSSVVDCFHLPRAPPPPPPPAPPASSCELPAWAVAETSWPRSSPLLSPGPEESAHTDTKAAGESRGEANKRQSSENGDEGQTLLAIRQHSRPENANKNTETCSGSGSSEGKEKTKKDPPCQAALLEAWMATIGVTGVSRIQFAATKPEFHLSSVKIKCPQPGVHSWTALLADSVTQAVEDSSFFWCCQVQNVTSKVTRGGGKIMGKAYQMSAQLSLPQRTLHKDTR
ncbi:uncharacterized protein LOC113922409 [Zalophus californianus]|uniref:Uncharacterized protein LOC113922409 n=1 Tax=Zalophus californianus TaxID=9704 RepID=A0A6P9FDB9_ZALCA|nr:uncharacterized protein LOC113922409 [Zalophus californianus]